MTEQAAVPESRAGEPRSAPELVIVTGMSGAGRSTAARVLEDLGWFVVDNLPPALIPTMLELGGRSQGGVPRIAVVVDVRSGEFFADLQAALEQVEAHARTPRLVFLEASDAALVRRFESVRRKHPLQGDGRIVDGIAEERQLVGDLRAAADVVIDTTDLNVHELRERIEQAFTEDTGAPSLHATVVSFGFKYGLPVDADLVVDVRFLPNPHWIPELRPLTGLDAAVAAYVLGDPEAQELLTRYDAVLRLVAPGYVREGKRYLTLAVGCTGGKHRSVAIAEDFARRLQAAGVDTHVEHRDLGRE